MTQIIASVDSPAIEHGILIDLTLPTLRPNTGPGTALPAIYDPIVYRISNCYKSVVYQGNSYTAEGGFLEITDIQSDLQLTNSEISLGLSAIPAEYIEAIMEAEIKGGSIKLYRVFFDTETQEVKTISGVEQVFLRFEGIINNYAISEDINTDNGLGATHSITVTASSILAVLENRVSGRRTNQQSYQREFAEQFINSEILTDQSMDRVVSLRAASFDFGRPD